MALAGRVNYEVEKTVNILADGDDTGVVFNVKSMKCRAARDVLQSIQLERAKARLTDDDDVDEVIAGLDASDMPRVYAACVSGWQWNGESFRDGDAADPDFSIEYCEEIFRDDGGYFIYEQVMEEVNALGNAKKKSKKKR